MIAFDYPLLIKRHKISFSAIINIILLSLSLSLSLSSADRTQCFGQYRFNSSLQIIQGRFLCILMQCNGNAIATFIKTPLALFGLGSATVLSNILALYSKD